MFKALISHLRDPQQLDAVFHIGGLFDVFNRDALDALKGHGVKIYLGAKGDTGQQRQLVPGVNPAHIQRWVGQFTAPDGGPADGLAKRSSKTVNGIEVAILDLTGTYLFKAFPMAREATPKPGYRMLAAIAKGTDAPVFFKLTAPKKTADAVEAQFFAIVDSLKK